MDAASHQPFTVIAALAAYLQLANTMAWFAFGLDQRCAAAGERRVPEITLLILATAGGWIGAKLGQ